jgi:hypothetical protein
MDQIVNRYLWSSILVAILFFVISSKLAYWVTNRITTTFYLAPTYLYSQGGSTLFGVILHSILVFAIVFAIIDYVYTSLNGDNDKDVKVE